MAVKIVYIPIILVPNILKTLKSTAAY